MSVRRNTPNHRPYIKSCHTCGRTFRTDAGSPFIRQIANVDGKKQKTCYFCSESCKAASYKHLFDGKAGERRKQREAARDISAKNRRYYQAHKEEIKARKLARYWTDLESAEKDRDFQRKKIKPKGALIMDKIASMFPDSCPFCGRSRLKVDSKKNSNFRYVNGKREDCHTVSMRCNVCHARGPSVSIYLARGQYNAADLMLDAAINAWNSRYKHELTNP